MALLEQLIQSGRIIKCWVAGTEKSLHPVLISYLNIIPIPNPTRNPPMMELIKGGKATYFIKRILKWFKQFDNER
jgi:hypothetical protein